MKKHINKVVIIYEDTVSFPIGGTARILDFDKTSRGSTSLFVLPMEYDDTEGIARLNNSRWIKRKDIKQIVDVKRPSKFMAFLKKMMFWRL